MLRKLVISNSPIKPNLSKKTIIKNYRHHTVAKLDDLINYQDKYWIWIGSVRDQTPVYAGKSVVRQLYSKFRINLDNTNWRVQPLPNVERWDVNPFKYRLANGYEEAYDIDAPPETNDVQDLVELIPDYWDRDEMPDLETIYETLGGHYERTDIEKANKLLGRSIPRV